MVIKSKTGTAKVELNLLMCFFLFFWRFAITSHDDAEVPCFICFVTVNNLKSKKKNATLFVTLMLQWSLFFFRWIEEQKIWMQSGISNEVRQWLVVFRWKSKGYAKRSRGCGLLVSSDWNQSHGEELWTSYSHCHCFSVRLIKCLPNAIYLIELCHFQQSRVLNHCKIPFQDVICMPEEGSFPKQWKKGKNKPRCPRDQGLYGLSQSTLLILSTNLLVAFCSRCSGEQERLGL